jgi:deoxyribodipyrimidine photolyase-related protein
VPSRWVFADQLGPHFADDDPDQPILLVESLGVLRRRRFHRQKAHLVLSALRRRARDLGDRAVLVRADSYGEALDRHGQPVEVCDPTSFAARRFVGARPDVTVLPERGFVTGPEDFARWVEGRDRRRLLMEDFYRDARRRTGVLMDGDEPTGGRWNLDEENREPPPKGVERLDVPEPWWPEEDEIDEEVRADLDRWQAGGTIDLVGADGPRWAPASPDEADAALDRFVAARLPTFGPWEDAMLARDPVMSHSLLSPALNLGLLDPLDCVHAAEDAHRRGDVPLASAEGYIRQVMGWRDYVWHVYWHTGPDYRRRNALDAHRPVPAWLWELDAEAVEARCLRTVLADLRDRGWVHHIPRLMVLGNWALQRGVDPDELTTWFHHSFVDGYDWVMAPNVVGMSQHADGGLMATKPYASGGAYINRMSDLCRGCRYDPKVRLGPDACPFTAGYWGFLARNRERLAGNARISRPLRQLDRLADAAAVAAQEERRGTSPP